MIYDHSAKTKPLYGTRRIAPGRHLHHYAGRNHVDVNPALVACGLRFQGRIAEKTVPEIFVDQAERKIRQEQVDRQPMIKAGRSP